MQWEIKKFKTEYSSCDVMVFDGIWTIYNLETQEEHRGRGCATKLVAKVIENFKKSLDTILTARTLDGNDAYKVFYKNNFKIVGRRNAPDHVLWGYDQT